MNKRFQIVPKQITVKRKICIACNGTGRYDACGSPKCGACDGTGFETKEE